MPIMNRLVLMGLTAICLGGCGASQSETGENAQANQNNRQFVAKPDKWPVRLSAGLALPQTLPNGTAIGFSVDYRVKSFKPDPEIQYLWEIKDGKGTIRQLPIKLTGMRGNLQQFVPIRPETGPFTSRIVTVPAPNEEAKPLTKWTGMH